MIRIRLFLNVSAKISSAKSNWETNYKWLHAGHLKWTHPHLWQRGSNNSSCFQSCLLLILANNFTAFKTCYNTRLTLFCYWDYSLNWQLLGIRATSSSHRWRMPECNSTKVFCNPASGLSSFFFSCVRRISSSSFFFSCGIFSSIFLLPFLS